MNWPQSIATTGAVFVIGLFVARLLAYRGVRPQLTAEVGVFVLVGTFAVRLLVGPETDSVAADALACAGAGFGLGAAVYARYDRWQDRRRERLQLHLDEALKDMVVTGPDPRDPRDQVPGEHTMRVMPRAIERQVRRQERRERKRTGSRG